MVKTVLAHVGFSDIKFQQSESLKSENVDFCMKSFLHRKGLGTVHMNMRSIISKITYIKVWAQQTNPDIFVFSETWWSDNVRIVDFCNCSVFRCDHPTKGGGVAIFVKSCLSVSVITAVYTACKLLRSKIIIKI